MSLYLLSLIAGVLTVLAPCVLPILPVIIGGSVIDGKKSRPWLIILSFAVSIIIFTLGLQYLVTQFGISQKNLTFISAGILIVFGIVLLFPKLRNFVMEKTGIENATNSAKNSHGSGFGGDILLGFILGPIFNTCSPTYTILVSNILPVDFLTGLTHILVYVFGLSVVLLLIAYGGRSVIKKMKWAANPNGVFKKIIAGILILLGVSILMGWDKDLEAFLVTNGLFIDTLDREIGASDGYDALQEE